MNGIASRIARRTVRRTVALACALLVTSYMAVGWAEGQADHAHDHDPAHDHAHEGLPAAQELPETSLYHLPVVWTDEHGERVTLADYRDTPLLITMFYGSCETACPILLHKARRLQEALQQPVPVLAVTFDPEVDDADALRRYAEARGYERDDWRFLRAAPHEVRMLATVLGVQYRRMEGNHWAHSNLIAAVDGEGRVVLREEGLAPDVERVARAVEAALQPR